MKNCIILGSGRSGSSMLAGSLADSGYYMGETLLAPRRANPKGFFEGIEIKRINEALLGPVEPRVPRSIWGFLYALPPLNRYAWRWLAAYPPGVSFPSRPEMSARMSAETSRGPFCFKDPRFAFTLPAWRPYLRNTVYVSIFREPARTAQSLVRECRGLAYLLGLRMKYAEAIRLWTAAYRNILTLPRPGESWHFFHYDQILGGSGFERLEAALGVRANRSFADPGLKRSAPAGDTPPEAARLYDQLCGLADYAGA